MNLKTTTALVAAFLPFSALAQSAGDGFRANGYFAIGYVDFGSLSEAFIFANADLGMSFGAIGADLSILSAESNLFGDTKIMGGVSYTFGNGSMVVAGMPRSGFDRYGRFNVSDTSHYLDASVPLTDKSYFSQIGGPLDGIGLRYDSADDGALKFSVSYLHDRGDNVDGIGGSASFETGALVFAGGLEYLDDGSATATQIKATAELQTDVWTFSGGASHVDASFGTQQTYLEAAAGFELTDNIAFAGFIGRYEGNVVGDANAYGLGGKYYFDRGANVGASALNIDGDTGFELSVGLDF
jgi:hypothetical protein